MKRENNQKALFMALERVSISRSDPDGSRAFQEK